MATSSWIQYTAESHFSLANIPFGIISHAGSQGRRVGATRVGEFAVDLSLIERAGLLPQRLSGEQTEFFAQPNLNAYAAQAASVRSAFRERLQQLFSSNENALQDDKSLRSAAVVPIDSVEMHLPFAVTDFIDYSIFKTHAINAGAAIFGPNFPLPPTFPCIPAGYNGRSSTVTLATDVVRPQGQCRELKQGGEVTIGPCKALDYEFELGAFIGTPTESETYVDVANGEDHIFGFVLLNDWSARDIQSLEMTPLGPLHGKSFSTSISPWVVTREALAGYRAPLPPRITDVGYPEPAHLSSSDSNASFDIRCDLSYKPASTSEDVPVTSTNFSYAYWSWSQLIAHQTFNGAPLAVGSLLGSGTISGPGERAQGCMLELTRGGKEPIDIGSAKRAWLEDGDEVTLTACTGDEDFKRVGFGELRGRVLPASKLRKAVPASSA